MAYKFNPFTGNLDEVGTGGAGSTPGGTDGAVQYNEGGVLKGNSDFTVDPDWNDAATVFTGLKLNVTDTASAAGSKLLDLQVNGTSKVRYVDLETSLGGAAGQAFYTPLVAIRKYYGSAFISNGSNANNGLKIGQNTAGFLDISGSDLGVGFQFPGGMARLTVDASHTFAQRNGTNAQTFRLYNTYTDASNYERTSITRDSSGLVIDAQKDGTGVDPTNLLDLQVGGTSYFLVRDREIYMPGGALINLDRDSSNGIMLGSYGGRHIRLGSDTSILFSPSTPTGGADVQIKRDQQNVLIITNGSTGAGYLKQVPVAVSALPAAATVGAGTRGFVSDSTVAASGNFGATVTGGGSNTVPVYSDGGAWRIG